MQQLVKSIFNSEIHLPSGVKLWHIPLEDAEPRLPFFPPLFEPEEEQEQESGSSAKPVENREEHKEETKQDKGSQFRESLKQQTIADYDISKIAELGQKAYEEELANNKSNTEKKLAAKRLADNRRKLYGDSEKNMNTSISDKLNDLSKSDDER